MNVNNRSTSRCVAVVVPRSRPKEVLHRIHTKSQGLISMSALSPHVSLAGFGYLEPLARPMTSTPKTPVTMPITDRSLPPRLASLTARLSPRSNWVRRSPATLELDGRARMLSPVASILDSSMGSDFGRSGVSPLHSHPPIPTIAREKQSTAQQRREVKTSEWHLKPLWSPPSKREMPIDTRRWKI